MTQVDRMDWLAAGWLTKVTGSLGTGLGKSRSPEAAASVAKATQQK